MKITNSYRVEIRKQNKIFNDTITIYRKALSFCVDVIEKEWSSVNTVKGKNRNQLVRNLIHSAKGRTAKYTEFDKLFYKFPSTLLTCLITDSLGIVDSFHSKYDLWLVDKKGKAPKLQLHPNKMPSFYYNNNVMIKGGAMEDDIIELKLYHNNDWVFVKVHLNKTDLNYIRKHCAGQTISCPTLYKKHNKVFLQFCFTTEQQLADKKDKILAVDLGVNTDAVCSVMLSNGTVLARKFINFPSEKDHLKHTLGKIKKQQKKYNNHNLDGLWRYANDLNCELSRKIAKEISDYAKEQKVDYIVFEHLEFRKCKSSQRITLWRKKDIQNRVERKAHQYGIRISRINPRNTSAYAYDGSGKVVRGKDAGFTNNKLCKFANGRTYNCDLNASYNIGARFFLREKLKTCCVNNESSTKTNVLGSKSRLLWTLSDLLEVS